MSFDLPFLTKAQKQASKLQVRRREPWGGEAEPRGFVPPTTPYPTIVPETAPPAPAFAGYGDIGLTPTGIGPVLPQQQDTLPADIGAAGGITSSPIPTPSPIPTRRPPVPTVGGVPRPTAVETSQIARRSMGIGDDPYTAYYLASPTEIQEEEPTSYPIGVPQGPPIDREKLDGPPQSLEDVKQYFIEKYPDEPPPDHEHLSRVLIALLAGQMIDPPEITSEYTSIEDYLEPRAIEREETVWMPITNSDGVTNYTEVPADIASQIETGEWRSTGLEDMLWGVGQLAAPLEVLGQTITELIDMIPESITADWGNVDAPTLFTRGFEASLEEFRGRPLHEQVIIGILTDPVVMFKIVSGVSKIIRTAHRAHLIPFQGLLRIEVAKAAPHMSDDAIDEITNSLNSSMMDDVIAKTPEGDRLVELPWGREENLQTAWNKLVATGEEIPITPGESVRLLPGEEKLAITVNRFGRVVPYEAVVAQREEIVRLQRESLESGGIILDGHANRIMVPLRQIDTTMANLGRYGPLSRQAGDAGVVRGIVDDVVTVADRNRSAIGRLGVKALGIIAGESVTRSSRVGKLTTALRRQQRAVKDMTSVVMATIYDSHLAQLDEVLPPRLRTIPVDQNGMWIDSRTGNVVTDWQNVFENPEKYRMFITPRARKIIDEVNYVTNVETPRLLDHEGITLRLRNRPENEYYMFHNVTEIRGIDTEVHGWGIRPDLRVHYDTVTEGKAAGIKYGINPRTDIELYIRWAYSQIAKKQFDDAIDRQGYTRSQLTTQYDTAVEVASNNHADALKIKQKLDGQIRSELDNLRSLGLDARSKVAAITRFNFDLTRLYRLLEFLPEVGLLRQAPARQALDNAWKEVTAAEQLQDKATTALNNAKKALNAVSGRAKYTAGQINALTTAYNSLHKAHENLIKSWVSRVFDKSIIKSPKDPVGRGKTRTLTTQTDRTRAAIEAAETKAGGLSVRKEELSRLVDEATDDLAVTKELTKEARKRLKHATTQAGKEQYRRGSIQSSSSRLEQDITRLQRKINRARSAALTSIPAKESVIEEVLDFLRAQQEHYHDEVGRLRGIREDAKKARSIEREKLMDGSVVPGSLWGPNQPDSIRIGEWRGKFFSLDDAQLIKQVIDTPAEGNWFTRGWMMAVNTKRALIATGDAAEPFIQGLPVLAGNPKAWGIQTARHYQAFFDPTVQSRVIRDHLADYQWMAKNGIPIGDLEYFAALEAGEGLSLGALLNILPNGQEYRRYFRTGGKQTFGRFQAMYNTGLGEARRNLMVSARDGWKGTDAGLAQWVRNMTGGLDSRALGIGPGQTAAEGFWLAFSPKLLRATIALLGDALFQGIPLETVPRAIRPISPRLSRGIHRHLLRGQTDVAPLYSVDMDIAKGVTQRVEREVVGGYSSTAQGRRALRTVATLVGGATLTYILTGMALRKDWDTIQEGLNPLNGKRFLSHEINGTWVGIGGQIRAITQAIGSALLAPQSMMEGTRKDNPFLQLLASRGAIGLQAVLQSGEALAANFGGEVDLDPWEEIDGWVDLGKVQASGHLPIAVQGLSDGDTALGLGLGFAGLRTSPWNLSDDYRETKGIRTEQIQEFVRTSGIRPTGITQVSWEGENITIPAKSEIVTLGDLEPHEQEAFKERYPTTFENEERIIRDWAKEHNAPEWTTKLVSQWDFEDSKEAIQRESDNKLQDPSKPYGPEEWKKEYYANLAVTSAQRVEVYDYDIGEPETVLDYYYAYVDQVSRTINTNTELEGRWKSAMTEDNWDTVAAWVAEQPPETQLIIERNTGLRAPTAQVEDFKNAKKILEPYWEVRETVLVRQPDNIRALYEFFDEFRDAGVKKFMPLLVDKDTGEYTNQGAEYQSLLNSIDQEIAHERKIMRQENPEIRQALQDYQYTDSKEEFITDMQRQAGNN